MKALSIRQPWAWLIVNGFKDIENRGWKYHPKFRGRFLIHASLTLDREMHSLLSRFSAMQSTPFFKGIGSAEMNRMADIYPYGRDELPRGGIVGEAEMVDVVTESTSPWFFGPLGFVLQNAKPLPFMPMVGTTFFFNTKYEPPQ